MEGLSNDRSECFLLFSQDIPSHDLGFVDSKSSILELEVGGQDVVLHQSPGILASNRAEGTTGAVIWKISPLFAEWISSSANVFFQQSILQRTSTILELGCGISGLVGLALATRVSRIILTDQTYLLKFLKQNLDENTPIPSPVPSERKNNRNRSKASSGSGKRAEIEVMELDWEKSSISSIPALLGDTDSIDAIVACDCVYNESLIEPLVRTSSELCQFRSRRSAKPPTLCIVAQQLRSPSVFQAWLERFHRSFRVWRMPDELLSDGLRSGSGYVVHLGIIRND